MYELRKEVYIIMSLSNFNNKIIELPKCLSVANQWEWQLCGWEQKPQLLSLMESAWSLNYSPSWVKCFCSFSLGCSQWVISFPHHDPLCSLWSQHCPWAGKTQTPEGWAGLGCLCLQGTFVGTCLGYGSVRRGGWDTLRASGSLDGWTHRWRSSEWMSSTGAIQQAGTNLLSVRKLKTWNWEQGMW